MKAIYNLKYLIRGLFLALCPIFYGCEDTIPDPEIGDVPSLSASFVVDGRQPLRVNFAATVRNQTYVFWDFGDGKAASGTSVSNEYRFSGTYTVKITAGNAFGIISEELEITVDGPSDPISDFTISYPEDQTDLLTVILQNTTVGGSTFQWNMGNGVSLEGENPGSYTYPEGGDYSIRLIAFGSSDDFSNSRRRPVRVFDQRVLHGGGENSKSWKFIEAPIEDYPSGYYRVNDQDTTVFTLKSCELNDVFQFTPTNYNCINQNDAILAEQRFECGSFPEPAPNEWRVIRTIQNEFALLISGSYIGSPATDSQQLVIAEITEDLLVLRFSEDDIAFDYYVFEPVQ